MGKVKDKLFTDTENEKSTFEPDYFNTKYILVNQKVIPEPDLAKWGEWIEKSGDRIIAKSIGHILNKDISLDKVEISTVFLGIDHSFGGPNGPILFETMVFGGPLDGNQERCATYHNAITMHEYVKKKVEAEVEKVKWL